MGKKDLNYIANLEKAISDKYGPEAVQNPKNLWTKEKEEEYKEQIKKLQEKTDLLQKKIEKIELSGFLISKNLLNKDSNRTCPTCAVYSFSSKDDVYMNKYDCCFKCYVQYVEDRETRWESGWRPGDKNEQ
tara:strand:- start:175 stop:567 length:393 start_codon:yes stop_codon:yes gene_type:complete